MKNFNSDSSSALSRFAKDKRLRTTKMRDEKPASTRSERPKRASFNPNFTDDNRPKRSEINGKRKTENHLDKRQKRVSMREATLSQRVKVSTAVVNRRALASRMVKARVTRVKVNRLLNAVILSITPTRSRAKFA